MKKEDVSRNNWTSPESFRSEEGSALVIALFVLALISVFVAFALSRTAAEAAAVGNETAEARTLYAAQGSLEVMTRNFNKVFERRLNPSATDLARVVDPDIVPGVSRALGGRFDLAPELDQTSASSPAVLTGGPYAGLYAIRDTWRLRTTASDDGGTQIRLTRNILNNRIPIFQFGIFYDDDLELFRPPRFSFGGRVHSNRHFFVSPGSEGVYFDSRVTAAGHIITQSWRNWYTGDSGNNQTWIKNASGVFQQLLPDRGSVLNGTPNVFGSGQWADPDLPSSRLNTNWATQSAIFDGNLRNLTKPLKLPLKVGNNNADLIELVKRGKEVATGGAGGDLAWDGTTIVPVTPPTVPATSANVDTDIQRSERFSNKTGIRVSLADSKAKLPGCASGVGTAAVTTPCGVRLDGHAVGDGTDRTPLPSPLPSPAPLTAPNAITNSVRGYQPKPMRTLVGGAFDYVPTRVNGERLFSGNQVWIKVEMVRTDDVTGAIVTRDITQDFLALGMTEQAPTSIDIANYNEAPLSSSLIATTPQSASSGGTDSRSVIKIQRFVIPGPAIPGGNNVLISFGTGSSAASVVRRWSGTTDAAIATGCTVGCATVRNMDPNEAPFLSRERYAHMKRATFNGVANEAIVPFPIKMFDTREGEHYDQRSNTYYTDLNRLTRNGIMSMIDIDIANLRRFFRGDFNGLFPVDTPYAIANGGVGLTSTDVPQQAGWVLYVSDRRGDEDFDGEFDMEDIYGAGLGNDGVMQPGEDSNRNGILDRRYGTEAERYNTNTIFPDQAAVNDHKYYRRGIRLINGTTLPGILDMATPSNTRGFTVASENGVYVRGNYNATHVNSVPAIGNTPYNEYRPFDTALHIPASIVADAVIILSNAWNDAQSFSSPYDEGGRLASTTQMRFAMISGDTIASRDQTPNQGGISPRLNGGVHNFKRFLERWTGQRLDYAGSLINLFNSRNNSGSFKCCNTVYDPPTRNWVFDSTFLDPTRIPPGTPFFQYVQTTGFERATD